MIQFEPTEVKILVVEDNLAVRTALVRLLQVPGYQVQSTATGEDGVFMARKNCPDLVLMDYLLPGMSGIEALKAIKAEPGLTSALVVVVSAGAISSEQQAGGLEQGADGYIVRPLPNQEFLARVNAFLRLKKTADALRASETLFSNSFEFAPIGMALLSVDLKWKRINQALCGLLGYREEELASRSCCELVYPEDHPGHMEKMRLLLKGEIRSYQIEQRLVHREGEVVPVLLSVSLVRNPQGAPDYLIVQVQDITERKRAEKNAREAVRREMVLRREIHHRVKNNLQVIISLLYLQSSRVTDPVALTILRETQDRVRSIALVHGMLYQREDLSSISFADYARQLGADLFLAHRVSQEDVNLRISADGICMGVKAAIPCGIIVTELITNALKYAFPGGRKGVIEIHLETGPHPHMLTLCVCDNGVGFPKDLDLNRTNTMGLNLVRDLASQLGGVLEFADPSCNCGTVVKITFQKEAVS